MGKRIIINDVDFSTNALPPMSGQELPPAWSVGGFIYSVDTKAYSDDKFTMRAYYLLAGQTYVINTTGNSTQTLGYGMVTLGTGPANIQQPTLTTSGKSIGAISSIVTTSANTRVAALTDEEITAEADCTLLITTANADSSTVVIG